MRAVIAMRQPGAAQAAASPSPAAQAQGAGVEAPEATADERDDAEDATFLSEEAYAHLRAALAELVEARRVLAAARG